jgi:hypothetical protein
MKKAKRNNLKNHFYLSTKVGTVHVNMNPNADKETFEAVQKMAELAYRKVK